MERDFNMKRERLNTADYNSHAHVERDFINFTAHVTHKITTHTLTWSVTTDSWEYGSAMQNYNSHAHVERDT